MGSEIGSEIEKGHEARSIQNNNSSMEWDSNAIFAHM